MVHVPDKQPEPYRILQQQAHVRQQRSQIRDNRQAHKEAVAHNNRHQELLRQVLLLLRDKVVAQQGRQRNRKRLISVEAAVVRGRHHRPIRRQAEAAAVLPIRAVRQEGHHHLRIEAVVRLHREEVLHHQVLRRQEEEVRAVAEEAQAAVEAEVVVKNQI